MNRFESASRVLSTALIFNLGALVTHTAEQPAVKVSAACTIVSPHYEEVVGPYAILIEPQPDKNDQYYLVAQNPNQAKADIFQKKLDSNATEGERVIDLAKVTPNHSRSVNFLDAAPGITMKFTAIYDHQLTSQGEIDDYIVPQVCETYIDA